MCHALVIEDDPFIAMLIEDALRSAGADTVAIAVTEDEAVSLADGCPPDFVASDVHLIDGSGPGAVAAILARSGEIPVVFITATPEACDAFAGRADILVKPVGFAAMQTMFERRLPARSPHAVTWG